MGCMIAGNVFQVLANHSNAKVHVLLQYLPVCSVLRGEGPI